MLRQNNLSVPDKQPPPPMILDSSFAWWVVVDIKPYAAAVLWAWYVSVTDDIILRTVVAWRARGARICPHLCGCGRREEEASLTHSDVILLRKRKHISCFIDMKMLKTYHVQHNDNISLLAYLSVTFV